MLKYGDIVEVGGVRYQYWDTRRTNGRVLAVLERVDEYGEQREGERFTTEPISALKIVIDPRVIEAARTRTRRATR